MVSNVCSFMRHRIIFGITGEEQRSATINLSTVAIVPMNDLVPIHSFAASLETSLAEHCTKYLFISIINVKFILEGPTLLLNRHVVHKLSGVDPDNASKVSGTCELTDWLSAQVRENRAAFILTDSTA